MASNRLPRASAALAAAAWLLAGAAYGGDDAPPPLPGSAVPAPPPLPPAAPAPGTAPPSEAPTGAKEGVEPAGAAAEPAPEKPKPYAQIEQKHVGRRVSEVIVTPAGFTYHYTMIHLDDQDPGTTPLHPHPELSVPRLFRIDF